MTELEEQAFDAFILWWEVGRQEFVPVERPDPRVGAAYAGFIAGFIAAKEEVCNA